MKHQTFTPKQNRCFNREKVTTLLQVVGVLCLLGYSLIAPPAKTTSANATTRTLAAQLPALWQVDIAGVTGKAY